MSVKGRKYSELVLAAATAGKLTDEQRPFEVGKQVLRHHGLPATKVSRNRAGQAFQQLVDGGQLVRGYSGWRLATERERSMQLNRRPKRPSARRRKLDRVPNHRLVAA